MRHVKNAGPFALTGLLVVMGGGASAATITGWDTGNVEVGPSFTGTAEQTGASVVYDRDVTGGTAGAVTNGQIVYDYPEANSPGIKVENGAVSVGGNDLAGCIMASSPITVTCDSPRQSGKRYKQQITGFGPTDLVFETDPTEEPGGTDGYRVFSKLINETGVPLTGFELTLGSGVGDDFIASPSGDGLKFSSSFEQGPKDASVYAQFSVGLFGEPVPQNGGLGGFFDTDLRAGFNMIFGEDTLQSAGLFGSYGDQFGPWLSGDAVPTGVFWDDDNDPTTDDTLLAWINEDGLVEQRRDVSFGVVTPLAETAFQLFTDVADLETALGLTLLTGVIEDLANLNMNFSIDTTGYTGESFTLRLTATPVPLPATGPLLVAGIGAVAMIRRRKRAKTA